MFRTWEESVWVDSHLAAIRWKANLRKDRKNIRSSHSEDRLTWIVYRALEGEKLVPQFCHEVLGLPPAGEVCVYYWQRLPNSERIDPDIDSALAEVERWHTDHRKQRTETDLILVGDGWLCPCEHKLGNPGAKGEPNGWRQAKDSPLRPEYEQYFRPLLRQPDRWHEYGLRFAQLLKNLSLGVNLAQRWGSLDLHLGVVINQKVRGKDGSSYFSAQFRAFEEAVRHPADHLHLATWERIREWLGSRQEPLCRLVCHALDENDWL